MAVEWNGRGMEWHGLEWHGIGMEWNGMEGNGREWNGIGMEWNGIEWHWNGMEGNGREWNGREWNGVCIMCHAECVTCDGMCHHVMRAGTRGASGAEEAGSSALSGYILVVKGSDPYVPCHHYELGAPRSRRETQRERERERERERGREREGRESAPAPRRAPRDQTEIRLRSD